jgi:hypothetical protein
MRSHHRGLLLHLKSMASHRQNEMDLPDQLSPCLLRPRSLTLVD